MGAPNQRSASVTAAAIVAILASLVVLMACSIAFFGLLLMKLPANAPGVPPFAETAALVIQGLMMAVSLFGIASGIGLIYLRNWARISILIAGGFAVFFGALGIPIVYFSQIPLTANSPALPTESMQIVRWILLVIYGLPLLIGVWWIILFNRKSVKSQFSGATSASDSNLPRKPSCPLPIAVLAWFYLTSILNLLLLPFFSIHFPVFIFGQLLNPTAGLAILILSCLALFVAGIGLLKLKPWSYSLTIGLQLFWLASSIVTALTPNYKSVMDSYLKEIRAWMHVPENQFLPGDFSQNYGWAMTFGLVVAGGVLGLLIYYRPRFLEEAARANSAA